MTTVWKSFYTIESLTSLNPMTDYWIPLAFYDDAFLHLLIGCADSHNTRCMHFEERPIALRHMQKALSIIKTRIATMRAVADETIAVIATLAFVEVCLSFCMIFGFEADNGIENERFVRQLADSYEWFEAIG
jgi:hypothetical protein